MSHVFLGHHLHRIDKARFGADPYEIRRRDLRHRRVSRMFLRQQVATGDHAEASPFGIDDRKGTMIATQDPVSHVANGVIG